MTKPPILAAGVAALGLAAVLAGCGSDSSEPAAATATAASQAPVAT